MPPKKRSRDSAVLQSSQLVSAGPAGGHELPSVESLWSIHCSHTARAHTSGSTDALSLTDPLVDELWQLFHPVLSSLRMEPISQLQVSSGELDAVPITHVCYLHLAPSAADAHEGSGGSLTGEMMQSLCEQPHVVLPLLEFFAAVMERQRRERQAQDEDAQSVAASSSATAAQGQGELGRVFCCVVGEPTRTTAFSRLGASQLGRLLAVNGTVVRMSPPRIVCTHMTYTCGLCGVVKEAPTEDGILVYPGACSGRCRGYKWVAMTEEAKCEEMQLLKIQENVDLFMDMQGADQREAGGGGGMNHIIEVELRHPLLDLVSVGDAVCVCGVLCSRRTGDQRKSGTTQQIAIRARSITATGRSGKQPTSNSGSGGGGEAAVMSWAPEESAKYYEMARQPHWFTRLAASVAPALYGLEKEKEALLLAIIGGSSGTKLGARSNIHLLLIGDPGMGKSQLLRAACSIAPRSAFVCAHTSSSCGLTMTLSRDAVSGETTFEAGAVVHGDGGVTCIDEMDKGASEHKALLEVMEQETVSIAKAGMVFSMPVHTAVLAAGNPIGGRFDFSKPITANLNISPALLSRFDVVVCMHDQVRNKAPRCTTAPPQQQQIQSNLTAHVLAVHRYGNNSTNKDGINGTTAAASSILPLDLVRQFILYCRTQCHPTLSAGASAVLRAHYLAERARRHGAAATTTTSSLFGTTQLASGQLPALQSPATMELPITPRYLQGLIRVSEARAKAELRHEVSVEDAQYAIELMQACVQSLTDRGGGNGGAAALMGSVKGKRKSPRETVVELLKAEVMRSGGVNRLSRLTILSACEEAGCKNPDAMLHQLNEFGLVLQVGDKFTLRGL